MYTKFLTEEGFDVVETSNAADAYDVLVHSPMDLVLLDIKMPQDEVKALRQKVH
jgi:DNA-binding response OmpR family regulator